MSRERRYKFRAATEIIHVSQMPGYNILGYPVKVMRELILLHMLYSKGKISHKDLVTSLLTNKEVFQIFRIAITEKKKKEPAKKKNGEPVKQKRSFEALGKKLGIEVDNDLKNEKFSVDAFLKKVLRIVDPEDFDKSTYVNIVDADGNPQPMGSIWNDDQNQRFFVLADEGIRTYKRLRRGYERFDPIIRAYPNWDEVKRLRTLVHFSRSRTVVQEKVLNYETNLYNFIARVCAMMTLENSASQGIPLTDKSMKYSLWFFGAQRVKTPAPVRRFDLTVFDLKDNAYKRMLMSDHVKIVTNDERVLEGYIINQHGKSLLRKILFKWLKYSDLFRIILKTESDDFQTWEPDEYFKG